MKTLAQTEFRAESFDSSRLNLHVRSDGQSRCVALFVHGLGGSGYGTWGLMPNMLFDGDLGPALDVAIFDYPSGHRDPFRRTQLSFHAGQLAYWMPKLAQRYEQIYLLAHSLGGVVAETVAQQYLTPLTQDLESARLSALLLFASPRAGSGWAKPIMGSLIPEFRWLSRLSDRSAEVDRFFSGSVEVHAALPSGDRQFLLPKYACIAHGDRFVSNLSATFGVPPKQILPLYGTHTSITKPTIEDHPQVRWFYEVIEKVGPLQEQFRREKMQMKLLPGQVDPTTPPPVIITELWSDDNREDWEAVYDSVRRTASGPSVTVHDKRDIRSGAPIIDLLISIHTDNNVLHLASDAENIVRAACTLSVENTRLTVGFASVGREYPTAVTRVKEWLPTDLHGGFYVDGARDVDGIAKIMSRWIDAVIDRHPGRNRRRSGLDRLLQVDSSPYDENGSMGYL